MRIVYCSQDYCPHDHRFLTALSRSEHQVYWLRLEDSHRQLESRPLPVSITQVQWRDEVGVVRWWQYAGLQKKFRSAIETIQPDLIHAGPIQPVSILPALIGFHPLVSMSWGFDMMQDADRNLFWKRTTKFVLAQSDWLFCDCHAVAKKAAARGFDPSHVTVFPWGVDLQTFKPAAVHKKEKRGLTILSTRSWEPRYGMDVALKGFALAVQTNPDLHLIMLSGGSQAEWIHQFVTENGLDSNVEFRGQIQNDDLAAIYQEAHVYLSASHVDGSSVALLEALACGTPAVVSNIPANLEWVRDGVEGWTFEDGNPQELAAVLLRIASQPATLSVMGENARRTAQERADWEKNVTIMLDAYQGIMEGRSK